MKLLAFHDPALGLIFEPHDVSYFVPISVNQYYALRHCHDRSEFGSGNTLWDDVERSTPITYIDCYGPLEKPCIKFHIPADKLDESVFATISAAIWKLLDTCIAKRDRDKLAGESA